MLVDAGAPGEVREGSFWEEMVWRGGSGHTLSNMGRARTVVMKLDTFHNSRFINITPKIDSDANV